jgi:rod shape-determining protein MreD
MALILIVNFVLQTTLFQYIEILGVKPNTALIIIVSYAILRGDVEGALFGFFSGLITDIFFSPYIGLYACMCMLIGFFCGKPFKDFYKENYFLPLSLAAASSLVYNLAIYFIDFLLRGRMNLGAIFRDKFFQGSVYTLILTVPLYSLMYGINKKLEEIEKKKRKLF